MYRPGIVREASVTLTEDVHALLDDIQDNCGIATDLEIFEAAIPKLHQVVAAWQENCVLVGVDRYGKVKHVMQEKDPDLTQPTLMLKQFKVPLDAAADAMMASLKKYHGVGDGPVLKLALENMAEMMEMRRAALLIEVRKGDAKGLTRDRINDEILNRAEANGRPLRDILAPFRLGGAKGSGLDYA